MNENTGLPETLHEAVKYFGENDNAWRFMVSLRWGKSGVICPTCGSSDVRLISTRKVWECKTKHEKRQFSVKVGTIFEDSPIALDKWFMAIWMVTNCKNGVSSYEIHRELGVTQKTGWFMLHRIRLAMEAGTLMTRKFEGDVEADETFIGGKAINMHKADKKRRGITMGSMEHRTTVIGMIQRPTDDHPVSKVKAFVLPGLPTTQGATQTLRTNVEYWSNVFTDSSKVYDTAKARYIHAAVDHAEEYVRGNVHTNGMENFWSLLKRSIKGTYVSVAPTHLFRYVAEQTFRFNNRKDDNHDRFLSVVSKVVGLRLTYAALITEDILCLPGSRPKRGKARA